MVSQQDARGDGGALVFMIDTPEGSLLYQDTSGHWTGILHDLRPDVAILAAAGRGNVDGEPVQGSLAGFVARQASLVRAPKVILSHHDDWLPGFSTEIDVKQWCAKRWRSRRRAPSWSSSTTSMAIQYSLMIGRSTASRDTRLTAVSLDANRHGGR